MSRPLLDPVWPLTVREVEQGPGSDSKRLLCVVVCVWGVRDEVRCFSRYKLFREDTCAKKATRTAAKSLFLGEFKG